jgi:putative transcriptional regulator
MSQAIFATALSTKLSTVCKWELGEKNPRSPSLKLRYAFERRGIAALS